MKLLIVTQVVDTRHPALGFFPAWIEEFARQCEAVTVVCLEKGEYSLPENVTVLSLGKETGAGKLTVLKNFFNYIMKRRADYDSVFVHMNPLYVVLGWWVWKFCGKKIGLWYTHGTVTPVLRSAAFLSDMVFTASPESFRINTNKKIVTGHGIDVLLEQTNSTTRDLDIITIGRLSRAKNLHTLITALETVLKSKAVTLHIVGGPASKSDASYQSELRDQVAQAGLSERVVFHGPKSHDTLPQLRSRAKVFVTAAQNGSLDKVILEAMASGLPVVSMAPGSQSLPLGKDQVASPVELAEAVARNLESGNYHRAEYVTYVKETHGLERLIKTICQHYV